MEHGGLFLAIVKDYESLASDLLGKEVVLKTVATPLLEDNHKSSPARAAVPVGRLPGDIAVEIAVVAAKDKYTVTRLHPVGEEASAGLSPAVLAGNTLYVTALAMPEAGVGLEEQFQAILTRQKLVLGLADMDLSNVVYADVYLADVADAETVRGLIGRAFGAKAPAGTIVGIKSASGAKVMVGLVAAK